MAIPVDLVNDVKRIRSWNNRLDPTGYVIRMNYDMLNPGPQRRKEQISSKPL